MREQELCQVRSFPALSLTYWNPVILDSAHQEMAFLSNILPSIFFTSCKADRELYAPGRCNCRVSIASFSTLCWAIQLQACKMSTIVMPANG